MPDARWFAAFRGTLSAWFAARSWTWLCGGCLAVLALGTLLMGFVPDSRRTEIRRSLKTGVRGLTERPATWPLSHVRWSMRGKIDTTPHSDPPFESAAAPVRMLPLAGGEPLFRTSLEPPSLLEALSETLFASGELSDVPDLLPGEEDLNLQSCSLSDEALNTLRSVLASWQKAHDRRARQLQRRATRFSNAVQGYAAQYRLKPDLVFAIMNAESSFNPDLVSPRNAHGLMQVVPGTAGGEVHAWLGRKGHPSTEDLLDPATNIRYGVAYLHLLLTRHLGRIENALSREYCAIASYNSGASAVLRVFGRSDSAAYAAINDLSPEQVRLRLLRRLPARESRVFLDRVLSHRDYFTVFNEGSR